MTLPTINWPKLRERAGGLAFALVLNLILLLALLTLAPRPTPPKIDDRNPVTFDMAPGQKEEKSKAAKSEEKKAQKAAAPQAQAVVRPPQPVQKPVEQVPSRFPFLTLNREQMAAADIGKLAKPDAGAGAGASGSGPSMQGPGEGPGGVQLFNAEWYRRPTNAELSPFLPANAPARGWGMVACKTIDHYHVENCQILGESPMGSGLARAVRLAAWQFLVLPPRINGKPQVGSWVRIRIDYTQTVVRDGGGDGGSTLGLGGGDGPSE